MAKDSIITVKDDYGLAYDEVRSVHDSFRFYDRMYEGDQWDDLEKNNCLLYTSPSPRD